MGRSGAGDMDVGCVGGVAMQQEEALLHGEGMGSWYAKCAHCKRWEEWEFMRAPLPTASAFSLAHYCIHLLASTLLHPPSR
jgi:hypothetical protein